MIVVRGCSIHAPLRRRLQPGASATVLSVHRPALNLDFGPDLLTAVAPAVGDGPGNLVCTVELPFTALGWAPGDPVRVGADGLDLTGPGGHRLTWAEAHPWVPPPPPAPATCTDRTVLLRRGRDRLAVALAAYGQQGGLLPAALAVVGREVALSPLAAFALPRVRGLATGAAAEAARGLLGLGPGLTPSGDDLLAGYAVTRWRAGRPTQVLTTLDLTATTRLSAHLLRWAGRGVAAASALALVDTLLADAALAAALAPVLAHGATSGSDWAAGVLVALHGLAECI